MGTPANIGVSVGAVVRTPFRYGGGPYALLPPGRVGLTIDEAGGCSPETAFAEVDGRGQSCATMVLIATGGVAACVGGVLAWVATVSTGNPWLIWGGYLASRGTCLGAAGAVVHAHDTCGDEGDSGLQSLNTRRLDDLTADLNDAIRDFNAMVAELDHPSMMPLDEIDANNPGTPVWMPGTGWVPGE